MLDADFANDRFSYAGNSLPGLAAFRTAIGGTNAPGGELLIGPHLAENATELIANGDFSEGVGDWQTNGGALAIVDGALQATGIGGKTSASAQPSTWRNSRRGVPLPQIVRVFSPRSFASCAFWIRAGRTWPDTGSKLSPGP